MTVFDVPLPIGLDCNIVGNDFDIFGVFFPDEIREDCTDYRCHSAALFRNIQYAEEVQGRQVNFYPETMITGISLALHHL